MTGSPTPRATGAGPGGTSPAARSGPETVRRVLKLAAEWLSGKGVDAPRLDAELLLAKVLGVRRLDLFLDHDRPLVEDELAPFRALLKRRAAREPLAYVLGEREFLGLAFEVNRDVLVPRPDTELLVTVGAEALAARTAARVAAGETSSALAFADVGTGSGCVAIALLAAEGLAGPRGSAASPPASTATLSGFALDVSPAALAVARRNAARAKVEGRLTFLEGDLLAPLADRGRFLDLVVSNPPYVLPGERAGLDPELRHEPEGALFDGEGLPLTRRLAVEAKAALVPGGTLAVETGQGSAALVRSHLEAAGFTAVETRKDLGGVERVVLGRA